MDLSPSISLGPLTPSFPLFSFPLLFSLLFSLSCNPSSRPSTWQHRYRIQRLVIFLVFFHCFAWENSQSMAIIFYPVILIEICCGREEFVEVFWLVNQLNQHLLGVCGWTCEVYCTKLRSCYPPLL